MNILIDLVPKKVTINNRQYEINSNFRNSILFEILMQDPKVSKNEKIRLALSLYYPTIPKDIESAVNEMLSFYRGAKETKKNKKIAKTENQKNKRVYSFRHDADYIYAAFMSEYGIDLQDIEYLHWWKFKALFRALKDDNKIVQIMGYRSMKIDNKMSKEEKKRYQELKRLYRLPDNRTEEEKQEEFNNTLSELF